MTTKPTHERITIPDDTGRPVVLFTASPAGIRLGAGTEPPPAETPAVLYVDEGERPGRLRKWAGRLFGRRN